MRPQIAGLTCEILLELYGQASPTVRRRGRSWYPATYRRLREIAEQAGVPPAHAVGVFSVVSPSVQVSTALRWTEEILAGERMGGRWPNRQAPLLEAVLASSKPARYISGPKVSAFYRALMGDTDALVLDRWAAYAGGYEYRSREIPRLIRKELDTAYRRAACVANETVRAFQAIVWILVRESTPTAQGWVPKLQDTTK